MDPILDSVPCGFLTFADDGVILSANATLHRLLERDVGTLVGQHIETLFTVGSRIFYQTHFFPLLKMTGQAEEIYLSLRPTTRDELPVLVNGARAEREGAVVYDCVFIPMRRRSKYEDEILRAKRELQEANRVKDRVNAELELMKQALEQKHRELQDRNGELETLKERLEEQVERRTAELQEAVKDLESFSYAIAHDLRAPLRAIVSTSEILREEAADSLRPEHFDLLGRQSYNGRKLSTLVDDLLRFAALGRAGVLREPINVTQIAMETIAERGAAKPRPSATFSVQSGMRATGDPALVRVALENLLDNAVKYSPGGGEIRVGVELGAGPRVFFVRDQGIGFDMAYAPKIFLPFERLHGVDEYEGNGIGLSTVQRIVERHGGSIWVESVLGQGSTFYFTLETST